LELQALDIGSPLLQQGELQRAAQRLLVDLSKACGDMPVGLCIDVTIESIKPTRHIGGFAQIHRGMLNGRTVAIKQLFGFQDVLPVRAFVMHPSCSDFLV
jgi:hypothetical protein